MHRKKKSKAAKHHRKVEETRAKDQEAEKSDTDILSFLDESFISFKRVDEPVESKVQPSAEEKQESLPLNNADDFKKGLIWFKLIYRVNFVFFLFFFFECL